MKKSGSQGQSGGEEKSGFSKWIAFILDDLVRIPGTKRRIGLDPLIGLIPGVGDFLTSTGGLAILAAGAKRRVPKSIYLKMASNWVVNSLIGAIPFVGDAFSFWFKSNRRNYDLLAPHIGEKATREVKGGGWWPLMILAGAVVIVFSTIGLVAWWGLRLLGG